MIIYQAIFGGAGGDGDIESPTVQAGNDQAVYTIFSFTVKGGTLGINDILHFEFLVKARTSNGPFSPKIDIAFGGTNIITGTAPQITGGSGSRHYLFWGEIANMGSLAVNEAFVVLDHFQMALADYDAGIVGRTGDNTRAARSTTAVNTAVDQALTCKLQWVAFNPLQNPSAQMITALVEIIA